MTIQEIFDNIDLELLKQQARFLEDQATSLQKDIELDWNKELSDEDIKIIQEKADLALGLLELVDNIIITLEGV